MLAPWKKSYDKPRQHIKKQRHHFVDKGPSSQSYGFSSNYVQIESWTVKKVECRKIDALELWSWRRLLRVPWTARSNQSILKKINPEYSHCKDCCWSWSANISATWCEASTHQRKPWGWERLRARGERSNRGWDGWMASLTQGTWVWANSGK